MRVGEYHLQKRLLGNQASFDPTEMFNKIDSESKGHISQNDLLNFFGFKMDYNSIFAFLNCEND